MYLKCTWLLLLILSFMAGALASSLCPAGYNPESNRCTIERPIHGSCPPGSSYSLNINKCVHS
ncbi:uncharacterized protein LOC108113529 [Drosophila eugracilis]|uniref:uncharacterized protein LOC108113529 n=1 Tax=Drosophila eugracilis TaxID=29029 RepID=UPI001BD9CAEA|nr:uncharacterized protein LOC108113529 [Drosophila eugracilis]